MDDKVKAVLHRVSEYLYHAAVEAACDCEAGDPEFMCSTCEAKVLAVDVDRALGRDASVSYDVHVGCCGSRINTISSDDRQSLVDTVLGWPDAHEEADRCPACGQVGEPGRINTRSE